MENTDLEKIGIYSIINKINNKLYIGSTSDSFRKRWNLHKYHLRNNKHKNSHLQYAWNKYGEDNFKFTILEICDDRLKVLETEQLYIDKEDFENLYNINPFATGGLQFSEESIRKRTATNVEKNKILSERYGLWKNQILSDENLDKNELDLFKMWSERIPWNKGKKYNSTDHLKVPKQKKGDRSKDIETKRNNSEKIEVYNLDGSFIKEFRSAKDLEEYSISDENEFNTKLLAFNIRQSCRNNKPYKNLIFKFNSN